MKSELISVKNKKGKVVVVQVERRELGPVKNVKKFPKKNFRSTKIAS